MRRKLFKIIGSSCESRIVLFSFFDLAVPGPWVSFISVVLYL